MDKYKTFRELNENEKEGADFIIEREDRGSDIAVIAIHGGKIEPGTTKVAKAIAADDLSFYSFESKKIDDNDNLHITSTNFDEPQALEIARSHKVIVSIHGLGIDEGEFVAVGGLDEKLSRKVEQALRDAGFKIMPPASAYDGTDPGNICNMGKSGKGVQIEISRKLRDNIIASEEVLNKFSKAVKTALVQ